MREYEIKVIGEVEGCRIKARDLRKFNREYGMLCENYVWIMYGLENQHNDKKAKIEAVFQYDRENGFASIRWFSGSTRVLSSLMESLRSMHPDKMLFVKCECERAKCQRKLTNFKSMGIVHNRKSDSRPHMFALPTDSSQKSEEWEVRMMVAAQIVGRRQVHRIQDSSRHVMMTRMTGSRLSVRFEPPIADWNREFEDVELRLWSVLKNGEYFDIFNEGSPKSKRQYPRLCKLGWHHKSNRVDHYIHSSMHFISVKQIQAERPDRVKDNPYWHDEGNRIMLLSRAAERVVEENDKIDRNEAASRIQGEWRRVLSDPNYKMCKRRLMREFSDLSNLIT